MQAVAASASAAGVVPRGLTPKAAAKLVEAAVGDAGHIARRPHVQFATDLDGNDRPYVKGTLKANLQALKDHARAHLGLGFDVSRLNMVLDAKSIVKASLGMDHVHRAICLHNDLLCEGWQCFFKRADGTVLTKKNAIFDLWMCAKTGHGEKLAPRISDCHTALQMHFPKSRTSVRHGRSWARFGGKGNQQVRRRLRAFEHCPPCRRGNGFVLSALVSFCPIDADVGLLPEERCGLCACEAVWDMDGGHADQGTRPFLPDIATEFCKFSWEEGFRPVPVNADGSLASHFVDAAGEQRPLLLDRPMAPAKVNDLYARWGKRINELRRRRDPQAVQLPVELLRSHSDRHGCVYNLKALGVTADTGAPHVCMSRYMWDNVYGIEDAVTLGERLNQHTGGGGAAPARPSRLPVEVIEEAHMDVGDGIPTVW